MARKDIQYVVVSGDFHPHHVVALQKNSCNRRGPFSMHRFRTCHAPKSVLEALARYGTKLYLALPESTNPNIASSPHFPQNPILRQVERCHNSWILACRLGRTTPGDYIGTCGTDSACLRSSGAGDRERQRRKRTVPERISSE